MYGKDGNLTMEFLFQAPTNRGLCWKTRMGRLIDKKLQQQNSRITAKSLSRFDSYNLTYFGQFGIGISFDIFSCNRRGYSNSKYFIIFRNSDVKRRL
jgi:hypothetical protein